MFEAYEPIAVQEEQDSTIQKLQQELVSFGLSPNEARVYIFLVNNDGKKAIEISRTIGVARTETYHLLAGLQNKGLVTATFHHPIKFNAVSFSKAVDLIISSRMAQIKEFEMRKDVLLEMVKLLPDIKQNITTDRENFQILKNQASIFLRAVDILSEADQEILVLGNEKDHLRFYHFDLFDTIKKRVKKGVEVKLLTSDIGKTAEVFSGINPESVKMLASDSDNQLCFLIKDRKELIFFISNDAISGKDRLAIWTDYSLLIEAMRSLFSELWRNSLYLQQEIHAA